jgi:hypothetical protein
MTAKIEASKTKEPATIRTWRSSEIDFLPRITGKPAWAQAIVPPSTLTTFGKPARRRL